MASYTQNATDAAHSYDLVLCEEKIMADNKMIYCTNCGKPILASSRFCAYCGQQVALVESMYQHSERPFQKNEPGNQSVLPENPSVRKFMVWSIINTVFFFWTGFPIAALIQSKKAKNATTPDEFKRHKNMAKLFNLIPYGIYLLIIIISVAGTLIDYATSSNYRNSVLSQYEEYGEVSDDENKSGINIFLSSKDVFVSFTNEELRISEANVAAVSANISIYDAETLERIDCTFFKGIQIDLGKDENGEYFTYDTHNMYFRPPDELDGRKIRFILVYFSGITANMLESAETPPLFFIVDISGDVSTQQKAVLTENPRLADDLFK